MSLGLDQPSLTSTAEAPPAHKSAGLAFFLSLLLPGAGQMYCGKVTRGATTLGFFALSVVVLLWVGYNMPAASSQDILGIAMLAILVLYIFSFLDAYYTAREISAGTDKLVDVSNPRVAATLNLLTNGFGYWYLGERTKGWIAFIVLGVLMRVVSQALGDSPWTLLLLVIPCAMALDAHRIARKQLAEAKAAAPSSTSGEASSVEASTIASSTIEPSAVEASAKETRLPAAVPVGFAVLLVATFAGVIGIGLSVPQLNVFDQSHAIVDQDTNAKRYENPTYGVRLLVPTSWEIDYSDPAQLAKARKGRLCGVNLMEEGLSPFRSLSAARDKLSHDLLLNGNFRKTADRTEKLGNLDAEEADFVATVNGYEVIQRYLLARRGLIMYDFVITMAGSAQQDCEVEVKWIRENIVIQK